MLSALHKPIKNSENDKLRSEYLFLSVLIYGFFISCLELFYPDNCLVFVDELNMIYKVFFIIHLSASAKVFVLKLLGDISECLERIVFDKSEMRFEIIVVGSCFGFNYDVVLEVKRKLVTLFE